MDQTQSGNVLFLILIAVALFAALSYAVTSSTRSGGGSADSEKRNVDAAALIQYPVSVQTAVQRQMLSNNVSASSLYFDPPTAFGSMTAAQLARQVFHPSGGGAIYQSDWWFGSCDGIRDVGTSGSGANAYLDIIAFKNIPSLALCNEINSKLGLPSTSTASMQATNYQYQPQMTVAFPGICNGGAGIEMAQTEFRGSQRGCYQDGDWGYLYYHVLVAR